MTKLPKSILVSGSYMLACFAAGALSSTSFAQSETECAGTLDYFSLTTPLSELKPGEVAIEDSLLTEMLPFTKLLPADENQNFQLTVCIGDSGEVTVDSLIYRSKAVDKIYRPTEPQSAEAVFDSMATGSLNMTVWTTNSEGIAQGLYIRHAKEATSGETYTAVAKVSKINDRIVTTGVDALIGKFQYGKMLDPTDPCPNFELTEQRFTIGSAVITAKTCQGPGSSGTSYYETLEVTVSDNASHLGEEKSYTLPATDTENLRVSTGGHHNSCSLFFAKTPFGEYRVSSLGGPSDGCGVAPSGFPDWNRFEISYTDGSEQSGMMQCNHFYKCF